MHDKPDQMSGFKGSLPPEEIYKRFAEALRLAAPTQFQRASCHIEAKARSAARKESVWDSVVSKERGMPGSSPFPEETSQASLFTFGFKIDDDGETDV